MKPRVLLIPALLALSVMGAAPRVPNGRVGVIVGSARRTLIADWDAQTPGDVGQIERAYCVTSYATFQIPDQQGDTLTMQIVAELEPAAVDSASRWAIRFKCRAGPNGFRMPTVHTHPATRCTLATGLCVADSTQMQPGGCGPSPLDMGSLVQNRLPFAIVQCGREIWNFYAGPG